MLEDLETDSLLEFRPDSKTLTPFIAEPLDPPDTVT